MTSMLGRESAGPERSRASAGPFPMPEPRRPCRIGTSVSVAKYINAPNTEATRFAASELPPTREATAASGMIPASLPGRPISHPATSTPPKRSGRICLANSHVPRTHSRCSSRSSHLTTMKRSAPAERAASGRCTFQTAAKNPTARFGEPQLTKTRSATIEPRNAASCHGLRRGGTSPAPDVAKGSGPLATRADSSFRKRNAIKSPMTTENPTAPTIRAMPSSRPRTRAVRIIARTLIAGPE